MSDNDLVRFANMPLLSRLHALLLNNNRLAKIETGLGAFLPNLTTLLLSNNKFTGTLIIASIVSYCSCHGVDCLVTCHVVG